MTDDALRESKRGGVFDICAGILLFGMILWGCTLGVPEHADPGEQPRERGAVASSEQEPAVKEVTEPPKIPAKTNEPPVKPPPAIEDPFTVDVTVNDASDLQESWLTIGGQSKRGERSAARGVFEGNNEFHLETTNVSLFTINLGALPETPNKRLTVHLDGQNLVVFPKNAALTFTRGISGQWRLLKR